MVSFPFVWTTLLMMANTSDGQRIEEEEEEDIDERDKRIFINHVDSYHGKHIARVSEF